MRHIVSIAVVIDVLLMVSLLTLAQERRLIQLPQDGTAAVITLEFLGGYGVAKKDNRPPLTIFANRTVRVVDASGVVPPIEAKISAEELQDLLRFAIDEHHFFEFDSATVQRELAAEEGKSGFSFHVSDGVTTVIRIRTAERDHNAEFYVLSEYAEAYPSGSMGNVYS